MLFSGGPRLNLRWVTPVLLFLAILIACIAKFLASLSTGRFVALLLNLVGTVLLASAFEPNIPKYGNGGWWDSLKFAVKEFPKYGSPPSFDFIRFYIGLFSLMAGIVCSVILS